MPKHCELDELLATFDHQRWSVACREMQVRLVRDEVARAHDVLDAFARFTGYTHATLASSVGSVLPVRIANELEDAGYSKLQSIDRVSDAQLLAELNNFAETNLATVRNCIARVKRGEVLEQYEEDAELLDEASFIRRLPNQCHCHHHTHDSETTMPEGLDLSKPHMLSTKSPTRSPGPIGTDEVLAAVDLLSSDNARQAIADRIAELSAEITRLRGIEAMLISANEPKKKRRSGTAANEKRIHDHIEANGPATIMELAEALKVNTISIGHAVAASSRMHKQGKRVVLS